MTVRTTLRQVRNTLRGADIRNAAYHVFDIETTGLTMDSPVVLVVYDDPHGNVTVIAGPPLVDSSARDEHHTAAALSAAVEQSVTVHLCPSEAALLKQLERDLLVGLPDDGVLAAYNGDGFDIPHLRTRALACGQDSPLKHHLYLEVMDAIVHNKAFNRTRPAVPRQRALARADWNSLAGFLGHPNPTALPRKAAVRDWVLDQDPSADELREWAEQTDREVPTDECGDLDGVFADLERLEADVPPLPYDPDVDGEAVAELAADGEFEPVVKHCIADVVKTRAVLQYLLSHGSLDQVRLSYL